jgi:hypothetical protein
VCAVKVCLCGHICELHLLQVDLPVFISSLAVGFEPTGDFHTPFILLSDILQNDKVNFHTFREITSTQHFRALTFAVTTSSRCHHVVITVSRKLSHTALGFPLISKTFMKVD